MLANVVNLNSHQSLLYLKLAPGKAAGHGVCVDVSVSLLALDSFFKQAQHGREVALLVIHRDGSPGGKPSEDQP